MKIGLFGLLFVVLLTLKLAGVAGMATVSWWVVFAPVYIPPTLFVLAWGGFIAIWLAATKR